MLLKEPKGRDVGEEDVFTINEGFKSKSIRVKLSAVSSQKEGDAEHIETRQKVRRWRRCRGGVPDDYLLGVHPSRAATGRRLLFVTTELLPA